MGEMIPFDDLIFFSMGCEQPLTTVDGWNPKQPPGMYETL